MSIEDMMRIRESPTISKGKRLISFALGLRIFNGMYSHPSGINSPMHPHQVQIPAWWHRISRWNPRELQLPPSSRGEWFSTWIQHEDCRACLTLGTLTWEKASVQDSLDLREVASSHGMQSEHQRQHLLPHRDASKWQISSEMSFRNCVLKSNTWLWCDTHFAVDKRWSLLDSNLSICVNSDLQIGSIKSRFLPTIQRLMCIPLHWMLLVSLAMIMFLC